MKKLIVSIAAGLVTFAALAQTSDYSIRQVRDPVQLQSKLNSDLAATTNRIAVLESGTNVGGSASYSAATLGRLTVQTNATVGGTLVVTGALSAASINLTSAAATTATNGTPTASFQITINGTNYLIKAYPN